MEIFNINQLKDYTFPEDEQGLAMANVIVVDEVAIADLAQKQQEALLKWVQDGGTLLLGATDQVDATAGVLKEYLPMSLSQEMTAISAETLTKLSGGGIFTQPISIHTATNHEGSLPVLTENNIVLASKKKLAVAKSFKRPFL